MPSRRNWRQTTIRQLQGERESVSLPARSQIVTESWNRVVAVPYVVYMPEKDRLMMLVSCDYPHRPMVMASDDRGSTWSEPRDVERKPPGPANPIGHHVGVCLTYLGAGKVILGVEAAGRYFSDDYGQTWSGPVEKPLTSDAKPWYQWDPYLVDKDPATGRVVRVAETGYNRTCDDSPAGSGYYGEIRFSCDQGHTWGNAIRVPEWQGMDEVALCRAANGDIVAACRTENPPQYRDEIDHYAGLAVSISRDNGYTWSKAKCVFEFGRHHPSLVLMPNGDLVMTYVVRKGYPDTSDGYPQFGIEAIVSRDHGQTWEMERRYVLATWPGNRKGENAWWASCQATSSLLLPEGLILTAFGTGYRSQPNEAGMAAPRDVGLVEWKM